MFSPFHRFLDSFRVPRRLRRGLSVFSRSPRRTAPSLCTSLSTLAAGEELEQRKVLAVDVDLTGTVLTVAFDDAVGDAITLEITDTGYSTTGANITSGTGTITKLVVTDAGTVHLSEFTLANASQPLTGGLSIGSNILQATIAAPVDTDGGDVTIDSSQFTLAAAIAAGGGSQTYSGAVTLAGDVLLSREGDGGSVTPDYGQVQVVGSATTTGLAQSVAVSADGSYSYVADGTGLSIFDVSNAYAPVEVGSYETTGNAIGVALSSDGSLAYVADFQGGLAIIDVSTPSNPARVSSYTAGGLITAAQSVAVSAADYAYVASGPNGLRMIDVSNPAAPSELRSFIASQATGVTVSGTYVYFTDGTATDNFRVIDATDVTSPFEVGNISLGGSAHGVAVAGNYAYVTTEASGLQVVDISDPANLSVAASYSTAQPAVGVTISPDGSHVVVTTGVSGSGTVLTLDISDPTNPTLSDQASLPGLGADVAVAADGFGYVADSGQGLQTLLFGQQQAAGSITFGGTIDGPHDLIVLDAQGTTTFSGEIGGSTPLANFGVGGTGSTRFAANVTTTGVQVYGADLQLQADVLIQGAEVAFFEAIDGGRNNLTVNALNGTLFDGVALYSMNALAVSGDAELSGTFYADSIDFQGNLTLIGDASLVAGQTAPNLTAVTGPDYTFSVATPENGTGNYTAQGRGTVVSPDGQLAALSVQGTGVTLWDISDPTNPQNLTDTTNPILWDAANAAPIGGATATAFSPSGNELYIAAQSEYGAGPVSFASLDTSDPSNATILDTIDKAEFGNRNPYAVQVTPDGQTAVVGMLQQFAGDPANGAVALIDLSDPSNLTIVGEFRPGDFGGSNSTEGLALSSDGRYAFIGGQENKVLTIVDISDPTNPTLVSQNTTSTTIWTITASFDGRYVYAGGDNGISVIDLTDINNPVEVDFESSYFNGSTNVSLFTYGIGLSADGLTLFAGSGGSFTDTTTSVVAYSAQNPADLQFGGFLSQSAVGLTNGGFINRVTNTPDGRTLIFNTFAFSSTADPADFNFYQVPYDSVAPSTVTIAGKIDGDGGNHSLVLETATGTVTVGGEIGGTQPLKDVRVLDQGVTMLTGNVTLTGTFDTLGQLVLGGDTTITAASVILDGGVEGAGNSFGINATSPVTIDAAANSFSNIANLEITGAASLNGTIATAGKQSFGGSVTLTGDTVLTAYNNNPIFVPNYEAPTLAGNLDTSGAAYGVTLSSDGQYAFVADYASGLQIIDVSNAAAPTLAGNLDTSGNAVNVVLSSDGQYAFVADWSSGLQIIDVSNVAAPTLAGNLSTSGLAADVTLSSDGQYAFVADEGQGLQIIDVSNVAAPTPAGNLVGSFFAESVVLSSDGQYAFVAAGTSDLQIVDVSNVAAPMLVGNLDMGGYAQSVVLSSDGQYAFIADFGHGLQIFDVSNVAAPMLAGTLVTSGNAYRVTLSSDGGYAFVTDSSSGLQIIDVSNVTDPTLVGNLDTSGVAFGVTLSSDGQYAFVADDYSGLQIIRVGSEVIPGPMPITFAGTVDGGHALTANGSLVSFGGVVGRATPLASLTMTANTTAVIAGGAIETSGAQTYGNAVNLSAAAEFIGNTGNFTAGVEGAGNDLTLNFTQTTTVDGFTNVNNFTSLGAVELNGTFTTSGIQHYAGCVSLLGDTSLTASAIETGSSLAGGQNNLSLAASAGALTLNDVLLSGVNVLTVGGDLDLAGNLAAAEIDILGNVTLIGDANVTGTGVSTTVIDYGNMSVVGNTATSTGGGSISPQVSANGQHLFTASFSRGLEIWDVSSPSNPSFVGSSATTYQAYGLAMSSDEQYAFVGAGTLGLKIYDVSNLSNPIEVGNATFPGRGYGITLSSDGGYAYVAAQSGGFQVFDVTDVTNPTLTDNYTVSTSYGSALSPDGSLVYVAASNALNVLNVADPTNLTLVGSYTGTGAVNMFNVELSSTGDLAYVAACTTGWLALDVTDPTNISLVGSVNNTPGQALDIRLSPDDQTMFLADGSTGFRVYDVSNAALPLQVGWVPNGAGNLSGTVYGAVVSPDGLYAYATTTGYAVGTVSLGTAVNGAGTVQFGGTVDGGYSLSVNDGTNGTTSFAGAVGGSTPLASLTTDASGTVTLGGDVTTTGDQSYGDEAALGVSALGTKFTGGNVAFDGGIDGSGNNVSINVTGTATLDGGTASFSNIGTLSVTGTAAVNGTISTIDAQQYDAVSLLGDTTLSGNAGSFATGVVGAGNSLTLDFATQTALAGSFSGLENLTSLGDVSLSGSIGVSGTQNYAANATLAGVTTLSGTTATFANGLQGAGNDLTINFTQTATLDGFGNVNNFTSLGAVDLNGTFATTGSQTFVGAAGLLNNVTLVAQSGFIKIDSLSDGGEGYGLTVGSASATADVILEGNVSLGSLTSAAGAFDVSLTGSNNTLGAATFQHTGVLGIGNDETDHTFVPNGITAPNVSLSQIGGTFTTDGAAIAFNDISLLANATLDTTNGNATPVGNNVLISGGVTLNSYTLITKAGTAATEVEGDAVIQNGTVKVEQGSLDIGVGNNSANVTFVQNTTITIAAGGGLNVGNGSALNAGNNTLTMKTDTLTVSPTAGNITGTSITITPVTLGNNIYVGNVTGSGLNITQNAYNKMQSANVTIGTPGYNGTITVDNLLATNGQLNLFANGTGGKVIIDGLTLTGNSDSGISLYVKGSGATTSLNGTITSANAVVIDDAVVLDINSTTIDTSASNADVTITGGTAGIYSASGLSNSLTINAGTGTVILGNQTGFGDDGGNASFVANLDITAGGVDLGAGGGQLNGSLVVNANTLQLGGNWLLAGNANLTTTGGTSLSADTTLAGTAATLSTAVAGGNHSLTLNFTGAATAIDGQFANIATLTAETDVTLNGSVTTNADQIYNSNVSLLGSTTLTGNAATFAQGVVGAGNDLTLNFAAESVLDGQLVGLNNLTSLGDVALNGTVTTDRNQNYAADVRLAGTTTLTTGNATTFSCGTVDFGGLVDGPYTLAIDSTLCTTFAAAVGSVTPLAGLTTGDSYRTFLGGNVTTTGDQNFTVLLQLTDNVTLVSSAGAISATSGIIGLNSTLTVGGVNQTGEVSLGGEVALAGLVAEAGAYNLSLVAQTGQNINVTGSGEFLNNGTLLIVSDISGGETPNAAVFAAGLNASLPSETIVSGFLLTENAPIAVNNLNVAGVGAFISTAGTNLSAFGTGSNISIHELTTNNNVFFLAAGNLGTTTITGDVNLNVSLIALVNGNLSLGSAATGANLTASSNLTLGIQEPGFRLAIAPNTTLSAVGHTVNLVADDFAIEAAPGSLSAACLTLTTSSDRRTFALGDATGADITLNQVAFDAFNVSRVEIGSETSPTGNIAMGTLNLTGPRLDLWPGCGSQVTISGAFNGTTAEPIGLYIHESLASTRVDANISSSSDVIFAGPVSLNAAVTTGGSQTYSGNVSLSGDANLTALAVSISGQVDGGFNLAIDAASSTTLSGPVGGTTPLQSLEIAPGGGLTVLSGNVTTTGQQFLPNPVDITTNLTLTGEGGVIGSIAGGGHALVLDYLCGTSLGSGGVAAENLASLDVRNGMISTNGSVETAGPQTYANGTVSLNGPSTLQGSSVVFGRNLIGNFNDLTLNFTQSTAVNGTSFSSLGNLTSLGPVALSGQIDSSGFQNYAAAATLSADITLNATGNVSFGNAVDGARQLDILSGGAVNFFAALGSTTPLQGLNLASAAAVTALGTLAIDGTGGTGAGLRIGDGVNNVNIAQPGSTITNANLSGILLAGNTTGSALSGFTVTNSGSHGIEAAGGDYTGTTIENSSVTTSAGDGFHAANATGLTGTLLHSAGNAKAGIRVAGTSNSLTISDSTVGLAANGTAAQPNLGQGVVVATATGTTLSNNTISGNGFYGVVVTNAAAGTTIMNNRIGVGTDGTTAIGNGQSGIFVLAGADGTVIFGNRISNNNGMAGIQVVDGTSNTTIGGSGPSANLLVGNGLFGITVSGDVPGTMVQGNLVSSHTTANIYLNNARNLTVGMVGSENTFDTADYGVYAGGDLTGTTIAGNTFQQHTLGGVVLTEAGNLTVRDNTLDDNGAYGIYGTGDLTGTTLQGNTISNHTVGVLVDNGANLTIGSANGTTTIDPDANVITKNTSAGVVVNGAGSQNVSILSNSIFENDFIGISFSAGGNALAVTPRLTAASTTAVSGSITGTDNDVYRIQYFKSADDVTSSSRFAQGEELLGYEDVTIVGGTAALAFDLSSSSVIVTDWITATATLLVGGLPSETSQFSFGIRVTA